MHNYMVTSHNYMPIHLSGEVRWVGMGSAAAGRRLAYHHAALAPPTAHLAHPTAAVMTSHGRLPCAPSDEAHAAFMAMVEAATFLSPAVAGMVAVELPPLAPLEPPAFPAPPPRRATAARRSKLPPPPPPPATPTATTAQQPQPGAEPQLAAAPAPKTPPVKGPPPNRLPWRPAASTEPPCKRRCISLPPPALHDPRPHSPVPRGRGGRAVLDRADRPLPPSGAATWRGQAWREGSQRYANRGGLHKQWWAGYHAAKRRGASALAQWLEANPKP